MNEHIEKLKKLKAPYWPRLLGNWRAWRRARAARRKTYHVTTVTLWTKFTKDDRIEAAWVHLYETGSGRRSFQYHIGRTRTDLKEYHAYHQLILPWLNYKVGNKEVVKYAEGSDRVPTSWGNK